MYSLHYAPGTVPKAWEAMVIPWDADNSVEVTDINKIIFTECEMNISSKILYSSVQMEEITFTSEVVDRSEWIQILHISYKFPGLE